jgi:hypothetical protein
VLVRFKHGARLVEDTNDRRACPAVKLVRNSFRQIKKQNAEENVNGEKLDAFDHGGLQTHIATAKSVLLRARMKLQTLP